MRTEYRVKFRDVGQWESRTTEKKRMRIERQNKKRREITEQGRKTHAH
jgi:hypothetical protein